MADAIGLEMFFEGYLCLVCSLTQEGLQERLAAVLAAAAALAVVVVVAVVIPADSYLVVCASVMTAVVAVVPLA